MPDISLKHIKNVIIYSVILGSICALICLLHALMPLIALFFLPFFGAVIPMVLLILKDNFYSEENKTYLILGAISGFFICLAFLLLFIIFVHFCTFVNKTYYDYGIKYLNFFLFILFFVTIASVFVSANAVIGLFCGIVHRFIRNKQNEQNNTMEK